MFWFWCFGSSVVLIMYVVWLFYCCEICQFVMVLLYRMSQVQCLFCGGEKGVFFCQLKDMVLQVWFFKVVMMLIVCMKFIECSVQLFLRLRFGFVFLGKVGCDVGFDFDNVGNICIFSCCVVFVFGCWKLLWICCVFWQVLFSERVSVVFRLWVQRLRF